ncbi:hypothetical protein RRG08_030838 [Elysia crispata]|uniref:Uncharacterized protein n=1 Tax=Elysia crispata TaxID=231223 RepID=A0AAE0XSN2_9GAST|nr:hypothetical protein RRG08_030838 [Elysia crispata]
MKVTFFICLSLALLAVTTVNSKGHITRPSFDEFLCVLDDNIDWMGPNLFNGADPELIASSLTMAADLSELSQVLYMEGEQEKLFIAALDAISNGDKKALVDMGMPAKSWHKVHSTFQRLLGSGFQV